MKLKTFEEFVNESKTSYYQISQNAIDEPIEDMIKHHDAKEISASDASNRKPAIGTAFWKYENGKKEKLKDNYDSN